MCEQLRLDVDEVPHVVGRLSPATILLGRAGIAECRAILAARITKQCDSASIALAPNRGLTNNRLTDPR